MPLRVKVWALGFQGLASPQASTLGTFRASRPEGSFPAQFWWASRIVLCPGPTISCVKLAFRSSNQPKCIAKFQGPSPSWTNLVSDPHAIPLLSSGSCLLGKMGNPSKKNLFLHQKKLSSKIKKKLFSQSKKLFLHQKKLSLPVYRQA